MKNRLLCLVIMCVCMPVFSQGGKQYIKINRENLRSAPNGKKIGTLNAGTEVEVLERRTNWVKVNVTCWIWEKSLTMDPTFIDGYQIRASHILVATETEAKQVLNRLKQGESFEALAKELSLHQLTAASGGDLGRFGRGDLFAEIEETAFKLKVGEYSGIVQSKIGFHIIKRTE